MAPPVRVTLIGRPGCHLCDVAREVIERVTTDLGVGWEERSVDSDPAWLERWSDQVPVTLVDGHQHDFCHHNHRCRRANENRRRNSRAYWQQ